MISTSADAPLERRLAAISSCLDELIDEHCPAALAVEDIFFGRNVRTAFAVGQARGAVLAAAGALGIPCFPYTPAGGEARRLRQRPRGQGPGPAHGRPRCWPTAPAGVRPRRGRARARDLPRDQPQTAARAGADESSGPGRESRTHDRFRVRHSAGARRRSRRDRLRRCRLPAERLRADPRAGAGRRAAASCSPT